MYQTAIAKSYQPHMISNKSGKKCMKLNKKTIKIRRCSNSPGSTEDRDCCKNFCESFIPVNSLVKLAMASCKLRHSKLFCCFQPRCEKQLFLCLKINTTKNEFNCKFHHILDVYINFFPRQKEGFTINQRYKMLATKTGGKLRLDRSQPSRKEGQTLLSFIQGVLQLLPRHLWKIRIRKKHNNLNVCTVFLYIYRYMSTTVNSNPQYTTWDIF